MEVVGFPRVVSIRKLSIIQVKKCVRKWCTLYVVHVLDSIEYNKLELESIDILREFNDVFPNEVPVFPPKREIDFSIDLTPGAVPISKAPYRMIKSELMELKVQI